MNNLIKVVSVFLIFCFVTIAAFSQSKSAILNKEQNKVYTDKLKDKGIEGIIVYSYESEKDLEKDKPNTYSIDIIDSLGNIIGSILYDNKKEIENYTIYEFDSLNQERRRSIFKSDNSIMMTNEYIYNLEGEIVEDIQFGESGKINSKTINYYDVYLIESEIFGPDGELTFNRKITHNDSGLPVVDELSRNGFTTMLNKIKYDENNYLIEEENEIKIAEKKWQETFVYNADNLLVEKRSIENKQLKSIKITEYFKSDFKAFLEENEFDYKILDKEFEGKTEHEYYLKSLAEFPGGKEKMNQYLEEKKNKYGNAKTIGVVVVGFSIDEQGEVSDVKVVKGISKKLDSRAMKIIKAMPKWTPAKKWDGSSYKSSVSISLLL